jgi:hypothetical protein
MTECGKRFRMNEKQQKEVRSFSHSHTPTLTKLLRIVHKNEN